MRDFFGADEILAYTKQAVTFYLFLFVCFFKFIFTLTVNLRIEWIFRN